MSLLSWVLGIIELPWVILRDRRHRNAVSDRRIRQELLDGRHRLGEIDDRTWREASRPYGRGADES
jgi:hypothetical protein